MLLDEFYKITDNRIENEKHIYSIQLNSKHAIYHGHFPNIPVVPGVCMIELVKEVAEKEKMGKTMLQKASNIKFLSIIDPNAHSCIFLELQFQQSTTNEFSVSAKLYKAEIIFFKMNASFTVVN
ncbi:MAG: hypothetical protein IPI10_14035 [Bacteroidetes bacterium]|nr:hypothetical protein [Bacteroidota bacterium]